MNDLISRSALKESLIYCKELGRKSFEAVLKVIDDHPTIEAVPVVHAEWKRTDIATEDGWAMYCCSNCNFHTEYYYSFSAKPEYNFCPKCGADMRKALL